MDECRAALWVWGIVDVDMVSDSGDDERRLRLLRSGSEGIGKRVAIVYEAQYSYQGMGSEIGRQTPMFNRIFFQSKL